MSTDLTPQGRRFLVFLSGIALAGLAIAFLDRPASAWSHAVLHRMPVFAWLTHIVDPLPPAAAVGLAVAGCAAAFGAWRPGKWGLTLIACGLSVVVSVAIKEQLKFAFGRMWPDTWVDHNPSWIANGAYGFRFFHGGEGWASFPSGHMAIITSAMAVLWQRVRPLRWLWSTLVAAVAVGLWGANFHFIGDIIAGAYLGAGCAAGVLALLPHLQANERSRGAVSPPPPACPLPPEVL
jgi:membrane-associated phospholipid phosphatase